MNLFYCKGNHSAFGQVEGGTDSIYSIGSDKCGIALHSGVITKDGGYFILEKYVRKGCHNCKNYYCAACGTYEYG